MENNAAQPVESSLERKLRLMSKIAEAVKEFDDPEIKRAAFHLLASDLGVEAPPEPTAPADLRVVQPQIEEMANQDSASVVPDVEGKAQSGAARQPRARKAGSKKSWSIDKEVNFWPADKQSLREFADQKKPRSIEQKNVVIVYYLTEILGMSAVNVGQVLAGFVACQWKPSNAPDVSLRVTASKYAWLDTSDSKAIKLTHAGRRFVEFDLPKSVESA
jgi:hypothetical protein